MAISPISITRFSQNLRSDFVLNAIRRTQRELFLAQSRLATGRSFLTPSEDPVAAARALDLSQALDRQEQFQSNLRHGDNFLLAADNALIEVNDLLIQSSVIASQNVGSFSSASERQAVAELVGRIRDQVQSVANRSLSGRFIFGGRATTERPFINAFGGVAYAGDTSELTVRIGEGLDAAISVPGSVLFGALSTPISNAVDLTPALSTTTRLDAVRGASSQPDAGVFNTETGKLVFNEVGGAGAFTVDLSGAASLGDVVDRINDAAAEAGAELTASIEDDGLTITPGASAVSISEADGGSTAYSFGLATREATTEPILAGSLAARVTRLTPVEALAGGAGIDLEGGLLIDNGGNVASIDLSEAETVQDIINAINGAGVFVLARINEAGNGIDVLNRVSGTALSIGENEGTTAGDLGIRTLNGATPLSELNAGRGVNIIEGKADLRITAKDGKTVDVNLDGAETINDVIDLMNEAATEAGVSVTAALAVTGNGIHLEDASGGSGALSVGLANLSTAARDLGLAKSVSGEETELLGDDVRPVRTGGIIDALINLEEALRSDDTAGITAAAERLDGLRNDVIQVQGIVGARSQAMTAKLNQMDSAATTTQQFLSQIQDLDFAEAALKLQAAVTQLQANLLTSSTLLNVSLLDFLR